MAKMTSKGKKPADVKQHPQSTRPQSKFDSLLEEPPSRKVPGKTREVDETKISETLASIIMSGDDAAAWNLVKKMEEAGFDAFKLRKMLINSYMDADNFAEARVIFTALVQKTADFVYAPPPKNASKREEREEMARDYLLELQGLSDFLLRRFRKAGKFDELGTVLVDIMPYGVIHGRILADGFSDYETNKGKKKFKELLAKALNATVAALAKRCAGRPQEEREYIANSYKEDMHHLACDTPGHDSIYIMNIMEAMIAKPGMRGKERDENTYYALKKICLGLIDGCSYADAFFGGDLIKNLADHALKRGFADAEFLTGLIGICVQGRNRHPGLADHLYDLAQQNGLADKNMLELLSSNSQHGIFG